MGSKRKWAERRSMRAYLQQVGFAKHKGSCAYRNKAGVVIKYVAGQIKIKHIPERYAGKNILLVGYICPNATNTLGRGGDYTKQVLKMLYTDREFAISQIGKKAIKIPNQQ